MILVKKLLSHPTIHSLSSLTFYHSLLFFFKTWRQWLFWRTSTNLPPFCRYSLASKVGKNLCFPVYILIDILGYFIREFLLKIKFFGIIFGLFFGWRLDILLFSVWKLKISTLFLGGKFDFFGLFSVWKINNFEIIFGLKIRGKCEN